MSIIWEEEQYYNLIKRYIYIKKHSGFGREQTCELVLVDGFMIVTVEIFEFEEEAWGKLIWKIVSIHNNLNNV